ncbi:MAG: S8/S53 family peptidase [Armatimonadetes bacterium]|nr:S8/S53 family peptidase [Armatimonadota bacterium]
MPHTVLPVLSQSMPSFVKALSSGGRFEVAISLKPSDPTGLQAFVDAVSDPKSAMYRQFISPTEVGNRFGASVKDIYAVKTFLSRGGLTITHVGKDGMTIAALGTQAQMEALFQTTISNFTVTDETGTVTYRANTTPLYVPATLVNKIQSIDGIETYSRPKPRTTMLTPPLTRQLYGVAPLFAANWQGQGRTVGISNWDGFDLNNGNLFITQYNLPTPSAGPMTNVSVVKVGTGSQNNGAAGEGDLDFQMVLAVAPLANIVIYDGTGGNITTVLSTEASDNVADVLTESYGWFLGAATAGACHNTHLAMEAQGMTYMAASGDSGTDLEPFDYPDYDPEVLSVGGTDATTDNQGNRVDEQTWGLQFGSGGGSGWCVSAGADGSAFNVRPSWQVGNGVPTTINKRMVPDASLHATDYAIYYNGGLIQIGGTSASSPTFAGSLAVCEGKLFAATNKARLGRLQDRIYALNGRSDVWFDVTTGLSTGLLPNGASADPTVGWDFPTGWGAINFDKFFQTLIGGDQTPFYAQAVTTVAGTRLNGTHSSLDAVDGNIYSIRSTLIKGLGQVGGFNAVYVSPFTNISSMSLTFTVAGQRGASAIVSLLNVNTGTFETVTTMGLTGFGQTKTLSLSSSQIASYVSSTGNVSMIIRAILPSRSGISPAPFTFQCDKAAFAAAPTS